MSREIINKRLRVILIVINIIFISMIGLVRTDDKSDSIVFALVPALMTILIFLFSKDYRLFEDRKNIKWDVILAGLFVLMLSAEDVLKTMRSMTAEPFNMIFKLIFFPLLILAVVIDIDFLLCMAMRPKDGSGLTADDADASDTPKSGKFLGIYYPVWLFIAATFVFLIAYFPGLMNSDFEKQWIWGEGPTQWSDWHTVGYLFFVKLCTAVIHKPFMITIVQALMYYLTANYAVGVFKRRFPQYPRMGWVYICAYMCFGFYSCIYISEVRKDNCSTAMMLAFSISLIDYILSREHTKREYINMGVFAFLASIFRHSLWEIVLVTLICVIIVGLADKDTDRNIKKKSTACLCVVMGTTVISFLIMTEGIAFGLLKAERNPDYVKYTVPMNLAASMAYRSRETGIVIDPKIIQKMEQIIPMEKWAEYYCPFDADATDRPWHEIGDNVYKLNDPKIARDIIDVNWYYLTHYPKQFILSFFDVNSIVWETTTASDLIMYSPGEPSEHYEIHHMRRGEFFFFTESVKRFMASFAVGRAVVYRAGLYVFLMAVITLVLFKKRRIATFTAMLPGLLYAAALMISIPQEGSHYIMVIPLYAALFGVIAYYEESKS